MASKLIRKQLLLLLTFSSVITAAIIHSRRPTLETTSDGLLGGSYINSTANLNSSDQCTLDPDTLAAVYSIYGETENKITGMKTSHNSTLARREAPEVTIWSHEILAGTQYVKTPLFWLARPEKVYGLIWKSAAPLVIQEYHKDLHPGTFERRVITPPGGSLEGQIAHLTRLSDGHWNWLDKLMFDFELSTDHGLTGVIGCLVWLGPPSDRNIIQESGTSRLSEVNGTVATINEVT